jgi:hypothetical protein
MPVRKYRDIADVEPAASHPTATENLRAAFDLIALCNQLRPFVPIRGVLRYHTTADRTADAVVMRPRAHRSPRSL